MYDNEKEKWGIMMEEKKYSSFSIFFSKSILFFYVVVGYLEKIHALYSVVIVLDAIISLCGFFFIIFWFYLRKDYRTNAISSSLSILTLTIFISSIVSVSDIERLSVAAFAIIESWAVAIAFIILRKRIKEIVIPIYVFILVFSLIYSLIGLSLGWESGETRYSGLSDQSNSLAVVAASSFIIAVSLLGKRRNILKSVVINIFLIALICIFAYTLYKSDSRTSFFALIISLTFFLVVSFLHSHDSLSLLLKSIFSICGVFLLIYFLLSSSRSLGKMTLSSLTSGRTEIWAETLSRMEIEEYIFGFGGNSARMTEVLIERGMSKSLSEYLGKDHLMHNIFIQFLVEYGIFSALSFAFGFIYTFVVSIKLIKKKRRLRSILVLSSTVLLFFFVHTMAESSIYFIGGAEQILFILSMAVIYSIYREPGEVR